MNDRNVVKETEPSKCLKCGCELSQGYVLGKHNRIRWSSTKEGMTIFHGVPLIKSGKKYWSNWRNWVYAPNAPALRCEECKLVFFQYDNEETEDPKKEKIASVIFGVAFIVSGLLLAGIAVFMGALGLKEFYFLRLMLVILSLIIMVPGLFFIKHGTAKKGREKGH